MNSVSGPQKLHFTLAVMGSRGDLYPMLAIGRALVRRGHSVVLATEDAFRSTVLEAQLEFRTLRPALEKVPLPDQREDAPYKDSKTAMSEDIFPFIEETYRDLLAAAAGSDLVLFPFFLFPGPMAAERLGIPWAVVHFIPGSFTSAWDPPYLPPVGWLYPLQRLTPIVPRLLLPVAKRSLRAMYRPLQELRAREGFPPDSRDPLLEGFQSPWLTLALFPACLGAPQRDWPRPYRQTGFVFYEERSAPRAQEIEHFLAAGEPPIVATIGSSRTNRRRAFMETTIAAARRLGQRLLLIAGKDAPALEAEFRDDAGRDDLLIVDYAPYSLVFPRARALIIAGSAGPLSHALRAGHPMLLVASEHAADQPDNALRAVRLGLGRWLHLRHYTLDRVVRQLRPLLQDARLRSRAAAIAAEVTAEDALSSACDALEAAARRPTPESLSADTAFVEAQATR